MVSVARRNLVFLSVGFLIMILSSTGCEIKNDEDTVNVQNRNSISEEITKSIGTGGDYNWYSGSYLSGQIETTIFGNTIYGNHNTISVTVPSEYVMIGGGAIIDYGNGNGALLTGSWPSDDDNGAFRTWNAQSKDHDYPNNHFLHVQAIGLKLKDSSGNYIDPVKIKSHLIIKTSIYGYFDGADVYADSKSGHSVLSGGGLVINPFNIGKLITKSVPGFDRYGQQGWVFEVKSHGTKANNAVQAYALFYDNGIIEGFGKLIVRQEYDNKNQTRSPFSIFLPPSSDYLISGVGGQAKYAEGSPGRLLFAISPIDINGSYGGYVVDKAHKYQCQGIGLAVHLVTIKKE